MKLDHLNQFKSSDIIEVSCEKKLSASKGSRVYFTFTSSALLLSTDQDEVTKIDIDKIAILEHLKDIIENNPVYLAAILEEEENSYSIIIKTFDESFPISFNVLFQDEFLDFQRLEAKDDYIQVYKSKYLIEGGSKPLCLAAVHLRQTLENTNHLYLVGAHDFLQIVATKNIDGSDIFEAKKITQINASDYRFFLFEGEIDFVLDSEEARLTTEAKMFIEKIKNDEKAYINIWKQYGNLEFEIEIEKIVRTGFLKYENCERIGSQQYVLTFSGKEDLSKFADSINSKVDRISVCVLNPKAVFEMYEDNLDFVQHYEDYSRAEKVYHCKLAKPIDHKTYAIYITSEADLPTQNGGYIFKSISGYLSMHRRRQDAFDNIFRGGKVISNLPGLLEGSTFTTVQPERDYIEPLSDRVVKKVFPKKPPTDRQKEAIEIALNTPDIALIQGPPGTGKTTVIVAIFERLNELAKGEERRKAKNLITAYQHDAVQNVAERLKILDLPTIKVGSKSTDTINAKRIIRANVESWINEKVNQLYEAYPEYKQNVKLQVFERIYKNYLLTANTIDETLRLLIELRDELEMELSLDLEGRLQSIIATLQRSRNAELAPHESRLLRWAILLPDHEVKFEDNGLYNVKMLIMLLEKEKNEEFKTFIEFFNHFLTQENKSYQTMVDAKKKLIMLLKPQESIFTQPKQREDILELFVQIDEYLKDNILALYSESDRILLDYLEEYELNPIAVQNTIIEYMSVIGATNQQSVSRDTKLIVQEESYDHVIIDEAARSNPLDLFIPMSRAKRKIILVGDHRQLPHIVDEKLVRLMEQGQTQESKTESDQNTMQEITDQLKMSLFQSLFMKMKELEKKDGIKRTITLDRQYRTHPLLGDFVSENFYEAHEEPKVESGLPAEMFSHQLANLENKAAVWIDIPIDKGSESPDQSKNRRIEAKEIVDHLKSVILSDAAKGLNFGIITFYAEQVNRIYEELARQSMARKVGNSYEILPEYAEEFHNGRVIEKLRIGTVDSFQGMEFDFVYLSMVRSNTLPSKTEKQLQQKYGFLMIENRLCVSMSRQKKMLVVVGDKRMLYEPNARKAISPLINFYEHCVKDGTYGKEL